MSFPDLNTLNPELNSCFRAIAYSADPAADLRKLRENGILTKVIPEFEACWGPYGEQDVRWHPEGNVWEHSLMVLDNVRNCNDIAVRFAAAFHDIAKPLTFHRFPDGAIASHGHEYAGAYLFSEGPSAIGKRFGLKPDVIKEVEWLIRHHMFMQVLADEKRVGSAVRNQMLFNPLTEKLLLLHEADATGTTVSKALQRNNVLLARRFITEGTDK